MKNRREEIKLKGLSRKSPKELADEWKTSRQTIDKDIKIVKEINGELFNNYGK